MTPDPIPPAAEDPPETRSTAGMTTKVVKGSLWTLAGQVMPLGVSFFATPFVIRLLGTEGYGVLIIVGLIPTYLGFADFGMSIASTKFASEAFAEGSAAKEARVVRTAAAIAFMSSAPVGAMMILFSRQIIEFLNVPSNFQSDAALALKFAAVTFVLNFLNAIFNTPQLTRLRMDLNTFVTVGFRVLGLIVTPLVLFAGGGVASAVFVLLVASILTLAGHLYVSGQLVGHLIGTSIERSAIRPMLRYGGALMGAGIASVLLVNLEKLVLTRVTSVETLAHYSVAFTLAMMTTSLSAAMTQSLIPAFSQLLTPEKNGQLKSLYSRSLRINIILMLPALAILFAIARPFFTIWAGEEFGRQSTGPFYVLLFGLAFAVNNYVPVSLLMAKGRTDIFAKLYWIELIPYIGLIYIMTLNFGAIGAATAWATRVMIDTILTGWAAKTHAGASYGILKKSWHHMAFLAALLAPVILIAGVFVRFSPWLPVILPLALSGYTVLAWRKFLEADEKVWLVDRFYSTFRR